MMLTPQHASVVRHQRLFGVTNEELRLIVEPMARTGSEPVGSMGSDTPLAVLSERPRLLYDYFTQLFAQVTNPPLDAIREELVTSLAATVGPEGNLLEPNRTRAARSRCRTRSSTTTTSRSCSTSTSTARLPASAASRSTASSRSKRAGRASRRRSTRSAGRCPRRSPSAPTSSSCRTGTPTPTQRSDPVAAAHRGGAQPPRAREGARPAPGSSSRAATPARCTTSPCWSATAPRP